MARDLLNYVKDNVAKWHTTAGKILDGIEYLQAFGYLERNNGITIDKIVKAVKMFQSVIDIEVDGEIGPHTVRAMQYPRCGCPDSFMLGAAEAINRWGLKELTYYIEKRDTDLTPEVWDEVIAEGFRSWEKVANLKFYKINNTSAHLIISVGTGSADGFDGPGRVLAYAYLPPTDNFKGQLITKFDTAERWIANGGNGIKLLNVFAHECGHLLALGHSNTRNALMAPFYNPNISKPQQNDDIPKIQTLYGPPEVIPSPPPTPAPPPAPVPPPTPEPPPSESLQININGRIDKLEIPGYRVQKLV